MMCLLRRGYSPSHEIVPERYEAAVLSTLPTDLLAVYVALDDGQGLMLWGPAGTGKTWAMCAIARDLWVAGWEVLRTSYDMLMLRIRDTYKPKADETERDVIDEMIEAQQLLIEDVGVTVGVGAQESDFSLRTFLVILDQRLEHCRPTYITSNKSVEELRQSFDARIASRIVQACQVVRLTGTDRRVAT